jgi:hypothetical protein
MKQIPFTLEAFGPDGLLKDGYEVRRRDGGSVLFVKYYNGCVFCVHEHCTTSFMHKNGLATLSIESNNDLLMYHRTRTAEEVAKQLQVSNPNTSMIFKDWLVLAVQAGMDEMTK